MSSIADVAAAKILSVDESQSQVVFYRTGTYYVKLPKHVTTFWVDAAGGGGGGGGGSPTGGGGAGGGGGCFCRALPIAMPSFDNTLCLVIGKGGAGGVSGTVTTVGTNGEDTNIYVQDISLLRLSGGFAPSVTASPSIGGKANYSNGTYAYTPPTGSTGNTSGANGEPAVWRDYVKSLVLTGNILSGSTGGNGGSWDGVSTSTGGNGGMSGVSYIASGAMVGSSGGVGYAGGGGGGISYGYNAGTDGTGGLVPTPTSIGEAPTTPGHGGHGGCSNKSGTDGADGFIRIYW